MDSLATYLAQSRKTQRWLAAQIPVRPATVCAWLQGRATPRPEHMRRIDEVTGGAVPISAWFAVAKVAAE